MPAVEFVFVVIFVEILTNTLNIINVWLNAFDMPRSLHIALPDQLSLANPL